MPVSEIGGGGADRIGPVPRDLAATEALLRPPPPWQAMPELHAVLKEAAPDGAGAIHLAAGGGPERMAARRGGGGPDLGELALDLTQIALDIVGIFEPTPFADIGNTLISAVRGDWAGAGLSVVGVVPYVGDLAKLGKLGRYAGTVAKAVDLAASSPAARAALEPALRRIGEALDAIPQGALDAIPAEAREQLLGMKRRIDEFLGRGADDAAQAAARQVPVRRLDAPDRADLDQGRVDALTYDAEQQQAMVRQGVGGARAEVAMGTQLRPSDTQGVDFFAGDTAIALKGPMLHPRTGEAIPITDQMVDGLVASVLKAMKTNVVFETMVVDTLNLSPAQRERLVQAITGGLADLGGAHRPIKILE